MSKIKIKDKIYKIEKLPLGKYVKLMKSMKKIPEVFSEFSDLSEKAIIAKIPHLIAESSEEVFDVLSIGSGIPKEVIKNDIGLDEAVNIFIAIVEVNKYKDVGKKVMGLFGQNEKAKKSGKSGSTK